MPKNGSKHCYQFRLIFRIFVPNLLIVFGIETPNTIFKMDLAKGRWDQNGNMSMRDYAVSRIAQLKQCEPTPPDDEIMWLLTRHYPYVIQNLLKTSFVKDLEQFQILLGDFDQTNVQFASYQNQSQNSSRPRNGNNNNQNRGFPPRHSQGQERPF